MSELSRRHENALRKLLTWSKRLAVGEDTEARRRRTLDAHDEVARLFFPDDDMGQWPGAPPEKAS